MDRVPPLSLVRLKNKAGTGPYKVYILTIYGRFFLIFLKSARTSINNHPLMRKYKNNILFG
jgi:hypothetical protein